MSINDLPGLSALRTRMQWHQERQRVLAENVANSDTPNFKPRDLVEPKFDSTGARRRIDGVAGDDAHQRQPYRAVRAAAKASTRTARSASRRGPPATPSISKTRCSRSPPTRWTMRR